MLAQTGPNARFAAECPVVILVCGDTSRETHKGYWPVDCAAAVQNMLLEATARGLGSLLAWRLFPDRKELIISLKIFSFRNILFHLPWFASVTQQIILRKEDFTIRPWSLLSVGTNKLFNNLKALIMTFLFSDTIFGPVHSRRFGKFVGNKSSTQ